MLAALLAVAVTLVVLWKALVVLVFVARPKGVSLADAARLLPDTVRLVRRLAAGRSIPRSTRWWVWFLLAYLVLPIDVIPDFVPVIGFADDVILTAFVLRHVVARAGPEKLREHWPGTDDALAALARLLRLPSP